MKETIGNGAWLPSKVNIIMSEEDKGYIAGFLDADGCISMHYNKSIKNIRPFIIFTNTNKNVILWIARKLNYSSKVLCRKRTKIHKDLYRVEITRMRDVRKFLIWIKNSLKIKRRQAELLIEFCEMRAKSKPIIIRDNKGRITKTLAGRKEGEYVILEEIRKLNKRGKS